MKVSCECINIRFCLRMMMVPTADNDCAAKFCRRWKNGTNMNCFQTIAFVRGKISDFPLPLQFHLLLCVSVCLGSIAFRDDSDATAAVCSKFSSEVQNRVLVNRFARILLLPLLCVCGEGSRQRGERKKRIVFLCVFHFGLLDAALCRVRWIRMTITPWYFMILSNFERKIKSARSRDK